MAFIVFEGLDHSGKSTLIQSLRKELNKRNTDVDKGKREFVFTREPGGTALGEKIREIVLTPSGDSVSPKTEILLISASRRDHIEKVIMPDLEAGKWVICDRFWPSTSAFQGAGRGLSKEQVDWLNQFTVPEELTPDLWVLLDMPVSEKEKRSQLKGHYSDHFEIQDRQFHQRVRECYLSMAKAPDNSKGQGEHNNWLILNALLPPEELTDQVIEEFKKRKWLNF